jgi:hypothetical protein
VVRRGKPGVPPKAAKVLRELLDDIDMPKPRKRGGRGGGGGGGTPRPHSNPDAPVPSHYRQVPYGSTHESRLVQQARLGPPRDRGGTYSAASWTDANGTVHHGVGKSDVDGHAETRAMDDLRAKIAQAEGHGDPSRVSLDRDGVNLYVEYSPCDTKPRFCQQQIADQAPRADVSYSHPWQPRSVRDTSREGLKNDIAALFERGTVGPL